MEEKYYEKLEFNKIKEILSEYAITFLGKEMSLSISPMTNKKEIEKAGKQNSEAEILIYRKGNLPLYEIENIKPHLKNIESQNTLSCKQLLDLANLLKLSNNLKKYFFSDEIDMSSFTALTPLFENLYTNIGIQETIFKSIIDENTLSDEASSTLRSIRRNISSKEQEIKDKLSKLLTQKFVQEPIVTIRNDRFVIPVKSEYRSQIKGFTHDISSSGSTVFVEPLSIFELNNEINNLRFEENKEIQKILQKLSLLFSDITMQLNNDLNLIGMIDFIFAKAKYSISIDGSMPKISDSKEINLINCYHPLIEKEKAVKNDIYLGKDFTSLIITGPNTGGKTVTLKTVGLLVIMAMSGINIPAKEGSSIYVFDNVFADIGDEQSIQDSLSTFSSHITKIAEILKTATSNSLVLLDELGSGTDPLEGASLAISILEELNKRGSLCISTTHYPELKNFAITEKGFENACVEFDLQTLTPTYKLLIGIPGTSQAFAISEKLGIPKEIIDNAKSKLTENHVDYENLLKQIYDDKRLIEKEKDEILSKSQEIKKLEENTKQKLDEISLKEDSLIQKAKEKATSILLEAKEDADEIIKNLENSSSSKQANELRKNLNKKIKNISNNIKTSDNSLAQRPLTKEELKLNMEVYIPKLNQTGTIIHIGEKDITVQIGIIKTNFKLEDLRHVNSNSKNNSNNSSNKNQNLRSVKRSITPKSISPEINVIGQNVDEACFAIDKYLDNCYLAGLNQVSIVHGKGTGALRKGIHAFLKTNPHVKSFRLGTFSEGETGVTIVELK